MNARKRMALAMVLLVAMLAVSTIGMATVTTFRHGTIRVMVQSDRPGGDNINLTVPASLAEAVVALAPVGMFRDEVPSEVEPFLPVIQALARELEELPDAVYVEVSTPQEKVRIEKRDGRFVVDVKDRHQTVHISVPVITVNQMLRKVRSLA